MIHAPKIYADTGPLAIPITVDEDVAGVQFDLWYNPSSSYVSIQFASGSSGLANEIAAGHLKVAFSGPLNLSNPVCVITLNVSESTPVSISNARGATEQAESIDLIADDGEILVGVPMDVKVTWQDNNPANLNVTSYNVYQDGSVVGTPSAPDSTFTVTGVAPGSGDVDFQVAAVNAIGEGPLSNTATVSTDLPIAVENVTAEIV
jgi:hypothetical protein